MGRLRSVALLLGVVVFAAAPALAQVSTGEIFGKVTDGTGAILPGATVTLISPALIQPQTVVTAESGAYRFPRIPVGTYSVAFELTGFRRTVREGIVIQAGFNAEIDARLDLSTVQETVTVTGESPIVDTRSTSISASFSKEALDTIPSARDPWVILEQTPGMVMDRQNVGGNQSGQQSGFSAMGSASNQQWNLDGAVISDIASNNSSPTYYDFDSFEEIQITTGGSDASQQGGGVQINFVTKSGGNTVKGSSRFYVTDERFEADNITQALRDQDAGAGNPIQNIKDYGLEIGGPIVKNRAWFWGARSRNDVRVGVVGFLIDAAGDPTDRHNLRTDYTRLDDYNLKLQWQERAGHKSTFAFVRGDKYRGSRGADKFHPIETTSIQTGPTNVYKLEHQWIPGNRLTLNGQYTHVSGGFKLSFQDPSLADVQPIDYVDDATNGRWLRGKSSADYDTRRPQDEIRADANLFSSNLLGGDHAMKFGFSYRRTPVESISTFGGGAVVRMRASGNHEANIIRNADFAYTLYNSSVYFNDSYKRGRATVNVGLRFDHQYDVATETSIPANRILPDLLPAVHFSGADSGVRFNDLAPRVGLTYDVRGNGRTVLKVNGSRYYGLGMSTANVLEPTTPTTLRYGWKDQNGDMIVQPNELDLSRFLTTPSSNYNPAKPSSTVTPESVDPNLQNDITDELIAGVEHELRSNFAVGANYFHRRYHQFQGDYRALDFSSEYVPVPFTAACGNKSCSQTSFTGVYYQRATPLHAQQVLRNNGQYNTYHGVELTARKRFSARWMMTGSYVWNRQRHFEPQADRDYLDPTNHEFINGYESGSRNVPWVAKLSGMYAFAWGITAAGFFNARDGFPFNPTIQSPNRTGSLGPVNVDLAARATLRYENFYQTDVHLDKALRFPGKRKLTLNADIFNLANGNIVLARTARQNTSSANNVTTILAPRVVRFGMKVSF